MDRELIRLRNQISHEHQSLNNRLNLLKFQAQRTKTRKDEDLRDLDKEIHDIRTGALHKAPQYSNQNFRASIASKQRDNSYERMIFSKIGSSNTFETPYKSKEDQYNKNFAVVSSKLALNSSFDPRTHNEQGMKGMYDYYKFGSQNKPDPFERDFSVFIDNSNSMINEISTLNNSGSKFNNDQMVKTNTLHNKVRKYPENVNYETIREYNKNKVRFHQGFSELGPANTIKFKQSCFCRSTLLKFYCILEESALSRNEEAVALSFLEDREYVDINLTNKELL